MGIINTACEICKDNSNKSDKNDRHAGTILTGCAYSSVKDQTGAVTRFCWTSAKKDVSERAL